MFHVSLHQTEQYRTGLQVRSQKLDDDVVIKTTTEESVIYLFIYLNVSGL